MASITPRLKHALKQDPIFSSQDKIVKTKTILKKSYNRPKRKTPSQTKPHLKFAGPIKIVIIEPKAEYCKTVWCAMGVGLTHMCVGATNLGVMHYSLKNGDIHATVCCLAFHFFSAEAILSLNYANGWSAPMRSRHKRVAHIFLQICGVACAVTGTILAILARGMSMSLHGLSGLIAAGLAGISMLSGILAYFGKRAWFKAFHMSFGIPAFLTSSISLCSGLFYKPFKDWAGGTLVYIMLALVIFYTTFIVASSFLKCLSRV